MVNALGLLDAGWGALIALTAIGLGFLVWRVRRWAVADRSAAAYGTGLFAPYHEASLATFASRELDVAQEIADAVGRLRAAARRQHIEVQVAVQPQLTMWADPCALQQMLAGMLTPAMERAPGGAVLVSAAWHGGRVQVVVMDDGPAGDHAALAGQLRHVEQCAALRGGTLEIECRRPRGNRVVLRIPGAGTPADLVIDDRAPEDEVFDETTARSTPWTRTEGAS